MNSNDPLIIAGSGSEKLTSRICKYLGVKPCRTMKKHFSEGTTYVRLDQDIRGKDTYVIQSTVFPANDTFMELLFWINALKRAEAGRITVVMPYFAYAKGDKMDEAGTPIRARVCADAIESAGADRIITMDLHAPQVQGFFKIPVIELSAMETLCEYIKSMELKSPIVVSPDAGFAKNARRYAEYLGVPLALSEKLRTKHDEKAKVLQIFGEVDGKTAIVVDDFTVSGGTLVDVAKKLVKDGSVEVYAMVTHGVLSKGAVKKIDKSPIKKLIMTDTVENQPENLSRKIRVVSVAEVFGGAIGI